LLALLTFIALSVKRHNLPGRTKDNPGNHLCPEMVADISRRQAGPISSKSQVKRDNMAWYLAISLKEALSKPQVNLK